MDFLCGNLRACGSCASSTTTIEMGIERVPKEKFAMQSKKYAKFPLNFKLPSLLLGMGPDSRVLVRKSRKQAQEYFRLYKVFSCNEIFNLDDIFDCKCRYKVGSGHNLKVVDNGFSRWK